MFASAHILADHLELSTLVGRRLVMGRRTEFFVRRGRTANDCPTPTASLIPAQGNALGSPWQKLTRALKARITQSTSRTRWGRPMACSSAAWPVFHRHCRWPFV